MRIPIESLGTVTDWRDGITWSAADLAAQTNRTARQLIEIGAGRGDRIVIWHGGSGRFFGDLMGVWKIGACAVCLNPSTTEEEVGRIVDFVNAAAVLDDGIARLDTLLSAPILSSGALPVPVMMLWANPNWMTTR